MGAKALLALILLFRLATSLARHAHIERVPDSVARLRGAAVTFLLPGRFGRVLLV